MSEKKRGLGRGLSALLPVAEEPIRTLPVERLKPNRFQPRAQFEESGLEELAESIRTSGLLQPIIVTPSDSNTYTIIAGERRWRAAQRAGLAVVSVVVRQLRDDRELLELALVENIQRSDLNPIEEAEAFRALAEGFAQGHEEIARRVGRSRTAITNSLRLLKLPPKVQELLRAGKLSAGQGRALLTLENPAEIERVALRAAAEGLSARALEAAGRRQGKRRKRRHAVDANTAAAVERLTQRLQTRVEIERRGKGGVVRVYFHSEEELMRLFEELMES